MSNHIKSTNSSNCSCSDNHIQNNQSDNKGKQSVFKKLLAEIIAFVMLVLGIAFDYCGVAFFYPPVNFLWFLVGYIIVALPVFKKTLEEFRNKDFFNEFSLMTISTIGAFYIGEYPEALGVMLFYKVGEFMQDLAVDRAKNSIKSLLDMRPTTTMVKKGDSLVQTPPESVDIGDVIVVKVGEKVSIDGKMESEVSSFDTSALTGENVPRKIKKGERVLAGMINMEYVTEIKVDKKYHDSALAKILNLAQEALGRKSKTELFIRKFAKIYTPVVFVLAILITVLPIFFVGNYVFAEWLYRGLVFLVISCPCALVVSVPLGYFSGIGVASKNGILFKGANFMNILTKLTHIAFDKTGTLTKGTFELEQIESNIMSDNDFVALVAKVEQKSNHPIARAILRYCDKNAIPIALQEATNVKEIAGKGIYAEIDGKQILVGNCKLLDFYNIDYPQAVKDIAQTLVVVGFDGKYAGYITIADEIKQDAPEAIDTLKRKSKVETILLSGDNNKIVALVATKLGFDKYFGELLPEQKIEHIERLRADKKNVVAFVGDGINDTPALALSNVSIAMGGLGSQAAIEIADVVIQTDEPKKIYTSIKISKETQKVVIQNIVAALSVKFTVLILGAFGIASLWFAVFADVGMALLAILNSARLFFVKFE